MKISGIQVDRFGIWSGVQFDNLSEGVNVFYGPNEAGKTTLMQFIRMVLYGFGSERAERYLRTAGFGMLSAGNRVGGSLAITTHDDEYHVRRYAAPINPLEDLQGELRVTARDGRRQGAERLTTLLTGIDELIFNNVYAVGLREMQYLGTLNDTQASRYLYNLSTGTDRVSLVDVMRQLQATRRNLVGGNDEPSLLDEMMAQRNRYVAEVGQFAGHVELWAQLKSELEQLDDEVARIESARKTLARRRRVLELTGRVQPIWEQRQKIEFQIDALGPTPAVTVETRSHIDELARQIESRRTRLDELKQQRQALESPAGHQTVDEEAFVRNALRVEALLEQRSTITALDEQLQSLKSRLDETEFEVQAELERLGLVSEGKALPQFDDQTLELLKEPARQVERDREMLEQVKQDGARLRDEAEKIGQELDEALGRDPDFARREKAQNPDTHNTGEIATQLRRRMALEGKLKDLHQQLEDMDARRRAILRSQLLPWEVIQALGALFSLGVLLLLSALFGESLGFADQTRTGMAIMGAIAAAVAALLKVLLDGSSRDELVGIQEQTDTLRREFELSEREARKLEQLIPGRRSGPFTLSDAQQRLTRLESLLPLDSRRRAMQESGKKYEQRAIEIAHRMKKSRLRWTDTLEAAGLSKQLTPAQLLQMASEAGQLARLHRECDSLRDQIADTDRELDVFGQRAADLLVDVGIPNASQRVVDMVGELSSGMRIHEQHRELAEQRLDSKRQLRDRELELTRELRQLESQRRALVSAQGAVDDDDLQRLLARRAQWEELHAKREALSEEIKTMLSDAQDERSITAELFGGNKTPFAQRLKKADEERARMDSRLNELMSRRGELVEKSRALADDRQLPRALLNIGVVDAKVDNGVEQAKIIGAMTSLLRNVYKRYENDRQPDTLKEASNHLRRMTGGKYTRIWTPLDQDVLFVDDPNRLSIPVDQLSRGTREQLFLALRLALVSSYARRGVKIPVVLDDVLVNFDVDRTRAAAEVLCEFGHAGNQVLIFSCHQHVMEIFSALGADVRTLPGHELPASTTPLIVDEASPADVESQDVPADHPPSRLPHSRPRHAVLADHLPLEFTIGYEDETWDDRPFGFDEEPVCAVVPADVPPGTLVPAADVEIVQRTALADAKLHEWDEDWNHDRRTGKTQDPAARDREKSDWFVAAEDDLRDAPFDRALTTSAGSSRPVGERVTPLDDSTWPAAQSPAAQSPAGTVAETVITGDASRRVKPREAVRHSRDGVPIPEELPGLTPEIGAEADNLDTIESRPNESTEDQPGGSQESEYEYVEHEVVDDGESQLSEPDSERDDVILHDSQDGLAETEVAEVDDVEYEYVEVDEDEEALENGDSTGGDADEDGDTDRDADEEFDEEFDGDVDEEVEYEYIEVDAEGDPSPGDVIEYEYIDEDADDEDADDEDADDEDADDAEEGDVEDVDVEYEYEYADDEAELDEEDP